MKRIDSSTASADENGVGRDGFTEGSPGVTPPTALNADWFNGVQEEIARSIELLGGTLDGGNLEQLGTLLAAMNAAKAIGAASSTDNAIARFDGVGGKTIQNSGVTIDDSANVATAGEYNYASAKARTIYYDAACATLSDGWAPSTTHHGVVASGASDVARFSLAHLPDGATITDIRVLVDPAGAATMVSSVMEETVNPAVPSIGHVDIELNVASSGTSLQWIDHSGVSEVVDKAGGKVVWLVVDSGQASDILYGIEVTFSDPGPRNI